LPDVSPAHAKAFVQAVQSHEFRTPVDAADVEPAAAGVS
jgi:hypothetical protein